MDFFFCQVLLPIDGFSRTDCGETDPFVIGSIKWSRLPAAAFEYSFSFYRKPGALAVILNLRFEIHALSVVLLHNERSDRLHK